MRVALALVSVALASAADFEPPVIGYFFDAKTQRIRPLAGTPGAAMIGRPVQDVALERALVSPDGAFAVVASPGAQSIGYLRLSQPEIVPIGGTPSSFQAGALSHSATAAAVYSESCRCVTVLASLRSQPEVARTIPVPEGATVTSLSITDDGLLVAIASPDRVWIDGAPFDSAIAASALSFSADGTQLAIADSSRKAISIVSELRSSPSIADVLGEQDGIAAPAGVRWAGAGMLVAADSGGGIRVVDLATRAVRAVDCPCKPALVEPMATARFFRVSGSEEGAVWIVETSEESLRALFVPEQEQ